MHLTYSKWEENKFKQSVSKKIENSANGHALKLWTCTKLRVEDDQHEDGLKRSGSAVLGGERSCMEDNTVEKNGPQNSQCVRGILYD